MFFKKAKPFERFNSEVRRIMIECPDCIVSISAFINIEILKIRRELQRFLEPIVLKIYYKINNHE